MVGQSRGSGGCKTPGKREVGRPRLRSPTSRSLDHWIGRVIGFCTCNGVSRESGRANPGRSWMMLVCRCGIQWYLPAQDVAKGRLPCRRCRAGISEAERASLCYFVRARAFPRATPGDMLPDGYVCTTVSFGQWRLCRNVYGPEYSWRHVWAIKCQPTGKRCFSMSKWYLKPRAIYPDPPDQAIRTSPKGIVPRGWYDRLDRPDRLDRRKVKKAT